MTVLTSETTKEKRIKSKFNDEFEDYLKNQCLKTTFNGLELQTFSWYKKVLGLIQQNFNKKDLRYIESIYFNKNQPVK